MAPARDEVRDRDAVGRDRRLRQQPQPPRDLLGGQRPDRLAVEVHDAAARAQHPRERPQQRRLAARVRAHDGDELPVAHVDVQPRGDDVAVVGEREVLALQHRRRHPRPLRRSATSSHAR
jgi:hypothetical protein